MNDRRIGIATVLYNSTRHLEGFVDSLMRNKGSVGMLVCVDNGSADDPECALRGLEGSIPYTLVRNASNTGYAHAINQGIRALMKAGYEHILVTNNDLTMKEGFFATLAEDMRTSQADVVGVPTPASEAAYMLGSSYDAKRGELASEPPISLDELKRKAGSVRVLETLYVQGGVILFNSRFFSKIGLYDERLFFGGDESDFAYRISSAQEKVRVVISLRAYDLFDHVTSHDGRFKLLKAKMITQGELYVLMKHGYSVLSPTARRKVKSLLRELGKGSLARIMLLLVLFLRAYAVNKLYLLSSGNEK